MAAEQEKVTAPISVDEKKAALDAVLNGAVLARSAQLRGFLRYVCEMEIAGRAEEINEYLIGVEALGRPRNYSATEDSTVRSRAYELRHKLERFYQTEQPDAPLRIEIPKGSYVPLFTRSSITAGQSEEARPWKRYILAGIVLLGVFTIGFLANSGWRRLRGGWGEPNRVLIEAWGPLSSPNADVLVCIGTYLHLLVRPNVPQVYNRFPALPELYPLFRSHRPLKENEPLYMTDSDSSVTFGEVRAAAIIATTLHSFGTTYQLLPERAAPIAALRNRNAVVFGIPLYSSVASNLLSSAIYTIEYRREVDELAIVDRRDKPDAPARFVPSTSPPGQPLFVYGLITVLPAEGTDHDERRTVIFSGLGSVGTHGAAEFFSSPEKLAQLRERFRRQGYTGFPPAYQVVVKCKFSDALLLSTDYVTHEVLRH